MDVLFFLLLIGVTSMVASDDHYSESDPRETTDMNVSWCRLHQAEAWSERLASALVGTRVKVVLLDCGSEASALVNVTDLRGSKHEIRKESNESVQQFVNTVLRVLCDPVMTVVEEMNEIHSLHASRSVFMVALLREPIECLAFQTSLLSVVLPESILPVILVFNSSLIPFSVDRGMKMWVAGDGDWWPLSINSIGRQDELRNDLIKYLNTLSFPYILEYNGRDSDEVNNQLQNFHKLYLLHHTDQLQVLNSKLILPLARRFLGNFVFVTVDCDLFPAILKKHGLSTSTELPYFVMLKRGNVEGVHVQHQHIPYTVDGLGGLLESVVNPEAHNTGPPPPSRNDRLLVSFTDLKAARTLADSSNIPLLVVFCKHDDPDCHHLYQALLSAASVVAKADNSRVMRLFVIQLDDISEVADLKVDILPSTVVHADGKWNTPFADYLGKSRFLLAIEQYSISIEEAGEPPSLGEFVTEHEELKEDDPFAQLYHSSVVLPDSIPHLNSSTYLLFNEHHSAGLIAFYLPYCVQCRPLLDHFIAAESQLVAGGVRLAVVNCAAYPDVCTIYNVSVYPTVLYRLSGNHWTCYHGVVTAANLVEKMGKVVPKVPDHPVLEELTPSRLPQVMASPVLPTLVMLCVKEPSPMQMEVMDEVKSTTQYVDFQFYWINSSLYDQLVSHLLQSEVYPAIVVVDYSRKFVFKKELTASPRIKDVNNFLASIASGEHQPDYVMKHMPWPPKIKAIKFPSEEYLRREGERKKLNGSPESVTSEYYPPPLSHPRSFPRPSSPPHPSSLKTPLDPPQEHFSPHQPSSLDAGRPPQNSHEEL